MSLHSLALRIMRADVDVLVIVVSLAAAGAKPGARETVVAVVAVLVAKNLIGCLNTIIGCLPSIGRQLF